MTAPVPAAFSEWIMPSPSRASRLVAAVSALALLTSFAAGPAKPARAPWTTSKVVGSPDPPPPYKVVRAFPNVKFRQPLLMGHQGDRLFVGEQAGVLYSFPNKPDAKADLFFDLRKELKSLDRTPGA